MMRIGKLTDEVEDKTPDDSKGYQRRVIFLSPLLVTLPPLPMIQSPKYYKKNEKRTN